MGVVTTPPGSGSGFASGEIIADLINAPERGYQPVITPSLTWNQLPSGVWRCLDDGAEFDAHDVDLTYLVSTAALHSWEFFISENRGAETTLYVPAGVQPFGPHIDASAGLPVVIGNAWKEAGRIGTKADCWTLHIPLRLQSAYTPTLPSGVPPWLGRKYATPDWSYPTIIHGTEAGRSVGVARGPEAQTTTITVDNLNTATAAEAVNWALHTRGSSFTYTPVAGMYPFGPAIGDVPFTCRLIEWSIQKPRPNRWDMQITLARE